MITSANVVSEAQSKNLKLGQLLLIVMESIFKKYFSWFRGLGPKSRLILIYQPNSINQKQITSSLWFLYSFVAVHLDVQK